jgi:hypothetical protein
MLFARGLLGLQHFHVFLTRSVKPAARQGKAEIFWARLIAAELYSEVAPVGMSP